MKYRYIRIGKYPTSQVDNQDIIRDCFAYCNDKIKAELELFFASNQKQVTFRFSDHSVRIEKI